MTLKNLVSYFLSYYDSNKEHAITNQQYLVNEMADCLQSTANFEGKKIAVLHAFS